MFEYNRFHGLTLARYAIVGESAQLTSLSAASNLCAAADLFQRPAAERWRLGNGESDADNTATTRIEV